MFLNDGLAVDDLDALSRELVNGLPRHLSAPGTKEGDWTKAVVHGLLQMGWNRGLYVCCRGSQDQGEWLLDVVWMNPKEWRILLAVESEWGQKRAIQEDFGKLMSIKARRKLLLFTTNNHVGADGILEGIKELMLAYPYHLAGEQYLALEVTAAGAFRYYFEVPSDGHLEAAEFTPMGDAPLPWPWMNRTAGVSSCG